jgi:hypothetical protein
MFLHPGYDTDVRKAQRAAAFKDETKFGTARLAILRGILGMAVNARRQNKK